MQRGSPDIQLFSAFALLMATGLFVMLSVSPAASFTQYGTSYVYLQKYFIFLVLGLLSFVGAYKYPYENYRKKALPLVLLSCFLVVLTYVPGISMNAWGATRWLRLGPFTFQPSEFAKLCLILYVAHAATVKRDLLPNFIRGFVPIMTVVGVVVLFILKQPDLGTSLVILITTLVILLTAGVSGWDVFIISILGARALILMIQSSPYQLQRILTFINPSADPQGAGYNIMQSINAVGSGGFLGVGIGQSRLKFAYLPQQVTDFIYAIICEETGLIGGLFVVGVFAFILLRGLLVAQKQKDMFGQLLAVGITFSLCFQAGVNMMVATGLAPTKGITLPFISYGGTSLIISCIMAGVLLQLSRETYSP